MCDKSIGNYIRQKQNNRTVWRGGATEEGRIQEKFPKSQKELRMLLYSLLEGTTRKYSPFLQDNHYLVTAVTASADTVLATTTLLNDINSYHHPAKGQHIFSEVTPGLNGDEKCYGTEAYHPSGAPGEKLEGFCESDCCSERRNEQEKGQQQVLPVQPRANRAGRTASGCPRAQTKLCWLTRC